MTEPIRPSAWRRARRNTARKVSAVRIARGEYQGCPPGVVRWRRADLQAKIAKQFGVELHERSVGKLWFFQLSRQT